MADVRRVPGSVEALSPPRRVRLGRCLLLLLAVLLGVEVLEDLLAGELARSAGHAATRVRAGAALVVALDRSPVLRVARGRAHEVHLRGEELAVEDVALGE